MLGHGAFSAGCDGVSLDRHWDIQRNSDGSAHLHTYKGLYKHLVR